MTLRAPTQLSPTLKVMGSPKGHTAGVLGPMLINLGNGNLFALTAAQIVTPSARLVCQQGLFATEVSAEPVKLELSDAPEQPCDRLIALVRLVLSLPIDPTPYRSTGKDARRGATSTVTVDADPDQFLGQKVVIQAASGRQTRGRLYSVNSQFGMPNPMTGQDTLFTSALEIECVDEEPLVQAGDAGALVISRDGAWLGIVVAGDATVAFAAPIGRLVTQHTLTVLAEKYIERHNRELEKTKSPRHQSQSSAAEIVRWLREAEPRRVLTSASAVQAPRWVIASAPVTQSPGTKIDDQIPESANALLGPPITRLSESV